MSRSMTSTGKLTTCRKTRSPFPKEPRSRAPRITTIRREQVQSRPVERSPLGRSNLGRDDDRLAQLLFRRFEHCEADGKARGIQQQPEVSRAAQKFNALPKATDCIRSDLWPILFIERAFSALRQIPVILDLVSLLLAPNFVEV